ncbi:hypothetical protein INR49_011849 [Caranx melampygus]|nr:hypothetical protein INR49_011849 [Caranx melampygus]
MCTRGPDSGNKKTREVTGSLCTKEVCSPSPKATVTVPLTQTVGAAGLTAGAPVALISECQEVRWMRTVVEAGGVGGGTVG